MEVNVVNRSIVHIALICVPALAVLAIPTIANAQSAPAQSGSGSAPQAMTRAQLAAELDARFNSVDANRDKSLDKAELDAVHARTVAEAKANLDKRIETEFARLDGNKDGQLSLAEFKSGASGPRVQPAAEMLKQLDRNGDGKVGHDEYRNTPLSNFDRIDTNKDGTVSVQEQAAARSSR